MSHDLIKTMVKNAMKVLATALTIAPTREEAFRGLELLNDDFKEIINHCYDVKEGKNVVKMVVNNDKKA